MSKKKILLCGLPESGKTTFIAALWYLLYSEEIPTVLQRGLLPKNRAYLNNLAYKWTRFIDVGHTPTNEVQEISLQLKDNDNLIDLHIPDMHGETWEALWNNRFCAEHAVEWTKDASGIMLFLHCQKIRLPLEIMDLNAMAATVEETPEGSTLVEWLSNKSPTQVVLVDILQALTRSPLGSRDRKLVIMISAWDEAEGMGSTPDEYLRVYFPLLSQFIQFSGDFTDVKIFGISALGGDLKSETDIEQLKAEDVPSERIKVIDGSSVHHDLTIPIQWLMKK